MTDDGDLLAEIADLRGHIVSSHRDELNSNGTLTDLAQKFAEAIANAIAASPIPADRVAQIGIGLPAIVDSRNGTVEHLQTFTGAPFPFALTVERELGIPTRVDNSINLLARAEHWFGEGTGVADFMVVLLDLGLGAARYHEGQLLLGSHGIAAELGHTKIVPEGGRPCGCGAHGCLQAYSSISAIVYQAAEIAGEARPGIPAIRNRFAALIDRARSGDREVVDLIARGGRYLGRALANHINMRAPERVIVLTKSPDLVDFVSGPFFEALHRDTLPLLRDLGRVTFKETDDSAFARGAAAMVLEQLYGSW
ncbi:ROK family protein [Novosphingobium endophyticum]|nr:ROK family protein [Novosphingobium endophyticum]